jgi:hypothetical protein
MEEKKPDKKVTIIVDGTPHEVPKGKITYTDVVKFSYPDYPQNQQTYSVKYKKGKGDKQDILPPGASVEVTEGMEFYVSRTGES